MNRFARPINDRKPNISQGFSSTHKGVDYAYINGTPVYASESGTVTIAKVGEARQWIANTPSDPYKPASGRRALRTEDYGQFIKIAHSEGYSTLYAHLRQLAVPQGDQVRKGQLIGWIGSTGNSTGNHLHWEVRLNDRTVDPVPVLDASFSSYGVSPEEPKPTPILFTFTDQTKIPLNLVTVEETYGDVELGTLRSKLLAKDATIKTLEDDSRKLIADFEEYKKTAFEPKTEIGKALIKLARFAG